MKSWVQVAWHVSGLPYGKNYQQLTWTERLALHEAVTEMVKIVNGKGD